MTFRGQNNISEVASIDQTKKYFLETRISETVIMQIILLIKLL